jgi:hypothetical protein
MVGKRVLLSAAWLAASFSVTLGCRSASTSQPVAQDASVPPPPASAGANSPNSGAGTDVPSAASMIEVPAGTPIRVRLNSSLDTGRSRPGDRFTAVLEAPIEANGMVLVAKGASVEGAVRVAESSGRLKGRAYLSIALDRIDINGSAMPVATDTIGASSGAHKKRNVALIGGGSGLGALIGGLAGGGRGALIGAGAGAAAGTAGAAATGKLQAHIAAESLLTFHLKQPLQIRS